jgi:hypothetical protein
MIRMAQSKKSGTETETRYWGNVLSAFEGGLQLDIRARLAIEFLKGGSFGVEVASDPEQHAAYALDCAIEFVRLVEERGLTKPLPDDDELSVPLRTQLRRNTRAQIYSQIAGQKISVEEAPKLATAANGPMPPLA